MSRPASRIAATFLTARWLGLAALLVLLVAAFVQLGRWQWQRTDDILAAERAAAAVPVPVESLYPSQDDLPGEAIGRPVIATGNYRRSGQMLVLHRISVDGTAGAWVLTPMDLADGSTIGILRGWVPGADAAATAVPPGVVRVEGLLHPAERFYPDASNEPGSTVVISAAVMDEAWGPSTRDGFVMLSGQQPVDEPAPIPVPATVQTGDVAFPLQNFFYAFQWWIFAAFAVGVYVRWLWLDAGQRAPASR